jgi:hypothetical protein
MNANNVLSLSKSAQEASSRHAVVMDKAWGDKWSDTTHRKYRTIAVTTQKEMLSTRAALDGLKVKIKSMRKY